MKLLLNRKYILKDYTIGVLFIDEQYLCEVVEDKVRDLNHNGEFDNDEFKVPKETAIPYGVYRIRLSMSEKFKRVLPMIENVKHFTGIRIHKGFAAKSTWGCLIPGENKIKGGVINSEKYEMFIIQKILEAEQRGEETYIHII